MGEVTTHEDNIIERVAIEYHGFDGDEYTLSWGKNKSSYRGGIRKMVRTVFASATRVGLTVVSAKSVAAKDAEIERLREYYEAREDIHRVGLMSATDEQMERVQAARAAISGGSDAK